MGKSEPGPAVEAAPEPRTRTRTRCWFLLRRRPRAAAPHQPLCAPADISVTSATSHKPRRLPEHAHASHLRLKPDRDPALRWPYIPVVRVSPPRPASSAGLSRRALRARRGRGGGGGGAAVRRSRQENKSRGSEKLRMLTSNSLHTESWLHLSHAIQPLNDGPGFQTKRGGEKEKKKKKKKKTKFKKKEEIHTRFPVAVTRATAALAEEEPRTPVLQLLSIT